MVKREEVLLKYNLNDNEGYEWYSILRSREERPFPVMDTQTVATT